MAGEQPEEHADQEQEHDETSERRLARQALADELRFLAVDRLGRIDLETQHPPIAIDMAVELVAERVNGWLDEEALRLTG